MPFLDLVVDTSGMRRKFALWVDNANDMAKPLEAWGERYLKPVVLGRYDAEGPGWAPRSSETMARASRKAEAAGGIEGMAQGLLRHRLQREVRRAEGNFQAWHANPIVQAREAARQAQNEGTRRYVPMAEIIRRRAATVERRTAVLALFEHLVAGGHIEGAAAVKIGWKLGERLQRRRQKVEGRLLGQIPESYEMVVEGNHLTYGSKVSWLIAHEEGLTVGNKAHLPQRSAAYLTDADVDILVDMLVSWLGGDTNMTMGGGAVQVG